MNFTNTPYDAWVTYGRSKTTETLLAVSLDARNKAWGVRAAIVHPGTIQTDLTRNMAPADFAVALKAISERHITLGNPRS